VVKHHHPALVGGFVSATGGRVNVLYYPADKCNRTLKLIFSNRPFLDSKEWQTILDSIDANANAHVRSYRQNKLYKKNFSHILNKLLSRWLVEQNKHQQDPQILSLQFHRWLATTEFGHRLAYHPNILQPVYAGIKRLLNLTNHSNEPKDEYQYIVLPYLNTSSANSMASAALCGIPSLNAFDGFITNFLIKLNFMTNCHAVYRSFALCMHRFDMNRTSISREYRKKGKSIERLGILDDRFCHFTASIIVQVRIERVVKRQQLLAALPSRLAGGAVHLPIIKEAQLNILSSMKASVQLISEGNHGCWIVDDKTYSPTGLFNLEFSLCSEYLSKNRNCIPIVSGMKLLEKPMSRQGAVDDCLHAFSEQVISIAQQCSKIQDKFISSLFWKREWQNDMTFFTSIDAEK